MTEEEKKIAYLEGQLEAVHTVLLITIRCLPNPALMNIHQFLKSDLTLIAQDFDEKPAHRAGQADLLEPLVDMIAEILADREEDPFSLVAATPEGYAIEQKWKAEKPEL